ncbi:Nn.00g070630.m01.CDS01 [Neocucurbitaria sp. VM-36]
MSSPNPNQQWPSWPNQQYQQPAAQYPDRRYSQGYPQTYSYYGQNTPTAAAYMQPHYGNTSPAPVIAELPAPLPPAPPTTTSEEQLKQDELLAHKLQQMEVEEVRKRSSSAVSQHQRPSNMAPPSPQGHSPLIHQPSSQSLPTQFESVSSTNVPYSPGYVGSPPHSLLPEVVTGPRTVSYFPQSTHENLPIPVIQDNTVYSPSAPPDPASLSAYLEQHRQALYPPQWAPPPVLASFYAYQVGKVAPGSSWLDTPESVTWRTIRPTEHARNPSPASYTFQFKTSSGSLRSPKHSWVLLCPGEQADASKKLSKSHRPIWAYELKFDSSTRLRKSEVLSHGREKAILTTYVHALNYDSLRFVGPDNRAYMWVSSSKLSSINGSRYDTLRHALFVATGNNPDPLYGQIVADHTFWDGYVDGKEVHVNVCCAGCQMKPIIGLRWKCRICPNHDVCNTCRTLALSGQSGAPIQPTCDFSLVNLPDEALYIRAPNVDPALVVATLQILKDWEKHTLRDEKVKNTSGFMATEETARRCDLGVMSYWKAGDWDKKGAEGERFGTRVKARDIVQTLGQTVSALGNVVDARIIIGGDGGAMGGSSGGDGGGGDGGGGGGGGIS